jgi:hypothetical protein
MGRIGPRLCRAKMVDRFRSLGMHLTRVIMLKDKDLLDLYPGEYILRTSREPGWRLFLLSIQETHYDVLIDLFKEVYPCLKAAYASPSQTRRQEYLDKWSEWGHKHGLIAFSSQIQGALAFQVIEGLRILSKDCSTMAENEALSFKRWLYTTCISTLRRRGAGRLKWYLSQPPPYVGANPTRCDIEGDTLNLFASGAEPPPFTIQLAGWHPFSERRGLATKRLWAEAKRQLNAELDRIQKKYEGHSAIQRRPTKREVSHFKWFVHYHVQGWSYDEIMKKYGLLEDRERSGVVQSAVTTTAKFLMGSAARFWQRRPRIPRRRKSEDQ